MVFNGIIVYFFGLIEGCCYDVFMLGESNLLLLFERMVKFNGDLYVVYGDFVYGIIRYIIFFFRGVYLIRL